MTALRLDRFSPDSLIGMRRGLEKESLRVRPDGRLAHTPHPVGLGSALTHPYITTDYSEALIELITPATGSIAETLDFLDRTQRFVYSQLGEEQLWGASMPCALGRDEDIPLAQYGRSNLGRMKTLYRQGLGHRYGRRMQTIAGIHYNLSFPDTFWQQLAAVDGHHGPLQDYISAGYFGLVRNFQRLSFLLLYLLGASPASCATFLRGKHHTLRLRAHGTLYLPEATSLRMSNVGYQNTVQSDLRVSYNSLAEYVRDLDHAIRTPYPLFEQIGVRDEAGHWRQINANLLQIENEYYSLIRPKRTTRRGERPTVALRDRGVEYVELRCVDLNPFEPLGISVDDAHFLEVFALYCLLRDSPPFGDDDQQWESWNQQQMVLYGRAPDLRLRVDGKQVIFRDFALRLCEELAAVAAVLDQAHGSHAYGQAIARAADRLAHPELTYSARMLATLDAEDTSFFRFAMAQSEATAQHYRQQPLSAADAQPFQDWAANSLAEQTALEAGDEVDFATFIANWFA